MSGRSFILLLCLIVLFTSCRKSQDIESVATYEGPFMEAYNIETLYSDSAVLRIRLKSPEQLELKSGDREFPKGLYIEFFDETGKKSATLKSNRGTYKKEENLYIVRGNVIANNIVEEQTLHTEELNWDPETKKVYTDKFVRIVSPEQIITGTGLDANEDFSEYTIRGSRGEFTMDEEEEEE